MTQIPTCLAGMIRILKRLIHTPCPLRSSLPPLSSSPSHSPTSPYTPATGLRMEQDSIGVVEHVTARLEEMKAMERALVGARNSHRWIRPTKTSGQKEGRGDGKRVFQQLPKHLRRRSASHDVYRVPKTFRQLAVAQMTPPSRQSSRRRIPRMPRLRSPSKRQTSSGAKWLQTHVWARKRMHMDKRWGYQVSLRACDKGKRASYHGTSHYATIQDTSYFSLLLLTGKLEAFRSVFSWMQSADAEPVTIAMDRETVRCTILYSGGQERPIGPAQYIWLPAAPYKSSEERLLLIIHPLMLESVQEAIVTASTATNCEQLRYRDLQDCLALFTLRGPKATGILRTAFTSQDNTWEVISKVRCSAELPRGLTRLLFVSPSPLQRCRAVLADRSCCVEDIRVEVPSNSDLVERWEELIASSSCATDQPNVPLCLIQLPGSGTCSAYGSGWQIIVPASKAMSFWTRFVYAGARAIGLDDEEKICQEMQIPHYPCDYVGTEGWQISASVMLNQAWRKHLGKPPGKRCTAVSLPKDPWTPWETLLSRWGDDKSRFSDESALSGWFVCTESHLDTIEDLGLRIAAGGKNGDLTEEDRRSLETLKNALVRVVVCMDGGGTPSSWNEICVVGTNCTMEPIGYLTSGGHSYHVGSGVGIGYCAALALLRHWNAAYSLKLISGAYLECTLELGHW